VLAAAPGDILFSYRQFPLTTVHPHSLAAAEAAEAAGAQHQYWQMHDLLFADQDRLTHADLLARARALGLDVDRFAADLERHRFAPKIQEDFLSGVRSGVNGTPTFFVNGVRHDGGADPARLLAAIERARASATNAGG
jgi:protein-disulfide isomerase